MPNRYIKIKPSEPPWINSTIKRNIRKRKRAYKKVKRTNSETDWKKFKSLRNKVVQNIRDSKKLFYDKIAAKLTSEKLSSKDWWSTLKSFIAPNYKTAIPPLEVNDDIYTEETDKANVLNNFFQSHTILNEQNAVIPNLPPAAVNAPLNNKVLSPTEVESVLKTLPVAKASGPNGLSNRVLRELSKELSSPSVLFSTSHYARALFLLHTKKPMFALSLKKATYLTSLIIDPFLCSTRKTNFWKDSYLNTYLITYVITIYFLLYNLAFFREIQLSTS